jgi:hypothetical protein
MGRFLIYIGIAFLLCSGASVVYIFTSVEDISQITERITAFSEATSELCRANETFGVSTNSTNGETVTRYYCTKPNGEQVDITSDVPDEIGQQLAEGFNSLIPIFGGLVGFGCGLPLALTFLIFGAIINAGSSKSKNNLATSYGSPSVRISDDPFRTPDKPKSTPTSTASSDLAAKLQNLEDLRSRDLISEEEYKKMRQRLIDRES